MHADELRRDVNEKEQHEDANEMKYDCDDLKNLASPLPPPFLFLDQLEDKFKSALTTREKTCQKKSVNGLVLPD